MSGVIQSGRFGVAVFDPTTISGLHAWWKADALTLANDDPVSTYTDSSGNGRDLAQTLTKRPTFKTNMHNSLPSVQFDGSNDEMTVSWTTLAQPFTVIHTLYLNTASGIHVFHDSMNTSESDLYANGTTSVMYAGTTGISVSSAFASATMYTVIGVFNNASSKWWKNGGAATTGTVGSNGLINGLRLGVARTGNYPMSADHCETLIYNSALGLTDVNNLGTYLTRWGHSWTTAT